MVLELLELLETIRTPEISFGFGMEETGIKMNIGWGRGRVSTAPGKKD